jgi:hypothetical protein
VHTHTNTAIDSSSVHLSFFPPSKGRGRCSAHADPSSKREKKSSKQILPPSLLFPDAPLSAVFFFRPSSSCSHLRFFCVCGTNRSFATDSPFSYQTNKTMMSCTASSYIRCMQSGRMISPLLPFPREKSLIDMINHPHTVSMHAPLLNTHAPHTYLVSCICVRSYANRIV